MDYADLKRTVNRIAQRCTKVKTPAYFECLEALDTLEFHVLDFVEQTFAKSDAPNSEMDAIRDKALRLHERLTSIAQATIDDLIDKIRTRRLTASALKQIFNQYADSVSDRLNGNEPDYDLFDDFLIHLFQIDYEPSETRPRTREMFYLQPTPGRIILEMINDVPFTTADRFYDLGSGLGRVPMLVSLLTDTPSVGIEYEPTYTEYARASARKLALDAVEFRNMDVLDADLSDGTIFFMYTPVVGAMLRRLLDRLHDLSQKRTITICTYGPCTPILERETWLHAVKCVNGELYRLGVFSSATST